MKIIFAFPLILFFIISALLFTGHNGAAGKVSQVAFFLLLCGVVLGLARSWGDLEGWGDEGEKGSKRLEEVLIFLGFAVPYIMVYRAFFIGGPLVFGDAPFFNSQNLKELFNPPFIWNFKDNNFGSTQYHILWLYLPTYLYGLLNNFLGLGNDILIRIIFYFPATVLAIFGSWRFIRKFSLNFWGQFLGSFLYGFNTYFLMLLDGGQVGVALAYGLFPLVSLSILSYFSNLNIKSFLLVVFSLFTLVSADIRIALLAMVFTSLVWGIWGMREIGEIGKYFKGFLLLEVTILGLSAFWVWPLVSSASLGSLGNLGDLSKGNNFISLTDTLFLFQPHFPLNDFGKVVPTPFYFVFLPILIFGNLFLYKGKKLKNMIFWSLLFLLFAFLAKGVNGPFGSLYSLFIDLPGGAAFRDSSKFYIPLVLIGSVLFSFTINALEKLVKKKALLVINTVIYLYLLLLIYPAIFGNLSGVLSPYAEALRDRGLGKFGEEHLNQEQGFFRTLYFEEKPAAVYFSWEKPVISANTLYQERPFASLITGKYDLNNFLHSPQFPEWFRLLGIKYIFFPENERKKTWSLKEQEERKEFLAFIKTLPELKPIDIQTSFPAYEIIGQTAPHIFGMKKVFIVIGGEDIYQHLFKSPEFSLKKFGLIFLEDGKVDLETLKRFNPKSLDLVFYRKNLEDLQMGYFVKDMVSPSQAITSQWKTYKPADYLIWKYELLKNSINTKEFDYGKGAAISTIAGEKIRFNIPVPKPGDYFLAVRFTNFSDGGLRARTLGNEFKMTNENPESFKWEVMGPIGINEKNVEIEVVNEGNFALLNTLALISEDQLKIAEQQAKDLTTRYKTTFFRGDMGEMGTESYFPISYEQINPTKYQLGNLPQEPLWIIFTDHYHKGWDLNEEDGKQFPFYAMINGFYLENPQKENTLIFAPQKEVDKGTFLSLLSSGIIGLISVITLIKKYGKKFN